MRQLFNEFKKAWEEGRYLDAADIALKMGQNGVGLVRLFIGAPTVGVTLSAADDLPSEEEITECRAMVNAPLAPTAGNAAGIGPGEIIAIVTTVFDLIAKIRAMRKQQA